MSLVSQEGRHHDDHDDRVDFQNPNDLNYAGPVGNDVVLEVFCFDYRVVKFARFEEVLPLRLELGEGLGKRRNIGVVAALVLGGKGHGDFIGAILDRPHGKGSDLKLVRCLLGPCTLGGVPLNVVRELAGRHIPHVSINFPEIVVDVISILCRASG